MESGDKYLLNLFARFDKHRVGYLYLLIAAYLFVNNSINASSVWMEHNRDGQAEIQIWEPFVWEYSSALSTFILLPLVFMLFIRVPLRFNGIGKQVFIHVLATVVYSAAHVTLMVMFREIIYWLDGGNYDFSPWLREFWYEYRKDAWGYLFWLILFHVFKSLYARLKGEASLLSDKDEYKDGEDEDKASAQNSHSAEQNFDYFIVRKLDKEFLVKINEIEWLESAGNYVNLHKEGRIYPLRGTLNDTVSKISALGFSRIHRGHAVNLDAIDNIQSVPSGDGKVTLKSGTVLNMSRRYKLDLKNQIAQ